MMFWRDKVWVGRFPIAASMLLEAANVGQLHRMWTVHSALGQNPWSWLCVQCALWMWGQFYRVFTPEAHWARRANMIGIGLNGMVVISVFYFRVTGRG